MDGVKVKGGIQPLCDSHYSPMGLVEARSIIGSDVSIRTAFACGVKGCQRQYHIDYGYYTVAEGQIVRESTARIPCPNDERAMYLDEFERQGNVRKWVCPESGCNGSKRTHGLER
jgi:hypothetical protein